MILDCRIEMDREGKRLRLGVVRNEWEATEARIRNLENIGGIEVWYRYIIKQHYNM